MEDKIIGRAVKELRCQHVGSIICVEIAVTRNYCGNNIGESEKPDIQEKEGTGPSGGVVCGWFAGGYKREEFGVMWTEGMSFKDGVTPGGLEQREEEWSRRGIKIQAGHL